jgi:predicted nuclease of predicted toxin-antitoxin system
MHATGIVFSNFSLMFLADENFPLPSVKLLRNNGFDVVSIQERYPGLTDEGILQMATKSKRIILTFDRDYGELIFRYPQPSAPAVVFFRDKGSDPLFAGQLLLTIITSGSIKFAGAFTVIEKENIRQRFYQR